MKQVDKAFLKPLAQKYIWWKTPDEALQMPLHIMAQVMSIGDYDDMHLLACHMGDDILREVLRDAQAGWFDKRSWNYWHYRLGMCKIDEVPALPVRKIPDDSTHDIPFLRKEINS